MSRQSHQHLISQCCILENGSHVDMVGSAYIPKTAGRDEQMPSAPPRDSSRVNWCHILLIFSANRYKSNLSKSTWLGSGKTRNGTQNGFTDYIFYHYANCHSALVLSSEKGENQSCTPLRSSSSADYRISFVLAFNHVICTCALPSLEYPGVI